MNLRTLRSSRRIDSRECLRRELHAPLTEPLSEDVQRRLFAEYFDLRTKREKRGRRSKKELQLEKTLVEKNYRLINYLLNKVLKNFGIADLVDSNIYSDLFGEAASGFLVAVRRYDPHFISERTIEPVKISGYAYWWVMSNVLRFLDDNNSTIRIPTYAQQKLRRKTKELEELERRGLDVGLYEDTSDGKAIKAAETVKRRDVSLDALFSMNEQEDSDEDAKGRVRISRGTFNVLIDYESPDQEKSLLTRELTEATRRVLGTLTPREQEIIRLRFGINEKTELTLKEIGVDFGVIPERIRQIEARALRTLRHPSRSKQLKDFVEFEE